MYFEAHIKPFKEHVSLLESLVMKTLIFILSSFVIACISGKTSSLLQQEPARKNIVIGTYGSPPTFKGAIQYDSLVAQLKDLKANTYNWLIMPDAKSFEQLKEFLPVAKKNGIDIWATLMPPSELTDKAEQYANNDMRTWAADLAALSLTYSNFKAWSIDDFVHNLKTYTPQYVKEFQEAAKKINPAFKFYPVCYYKFVDQKFVTDYASRIDGIVFPYRNESSAKADLTNASHVANEINTLKNDFGKNFPVFLDVYSSRHSQYGDPSKEYISQVIQAGMQNADGIIIYRHPSPKWDAEKYQAIRTAIAKGIQK